MSQFICLFSISNNQSVEVTRASDLELCLGIPLSDFDQLGVASTCLLKEVANISDLLGHDTNYKLK